MNPDVKRLWLEALRSGEYKQARETLKQDGSFCCLGVLCDLHRKITKKKDNHWNGDTYMLQNAELPWRVKEWAGLEKTDPVAKLPDNRIVCLSAINDGCVRTNIQKHSFEEIAGLIEDQL